MREVDASIVGDPYEVDLFRGPERLGVDEADARMRGDRRVQERVAGCGWKRSDAPRDERAHVVRHR